MRIAHITATFPPYWGGTGNVAYYNARELVRRGHEVHIFTPRTHNNIALETKDGISIHRLKPIFRLGNAFLLPGLLSIKDYDVIHFHYPFFGGEFAVWVANKHKIPVIVTYHQDVHLEGIADHLERILRLTVSKWVLNHAHRILFTSIDYGKASYARGIIHLKDDKICEMPNGVDVTHFCPGSPDPALTQKYSSTQKEKIILLVARLDRAHFFKGVPIFINALSRIQVNVKAIIVGDGDLRTEYEMLAHSFGLDERIFFTGSVSIDELPSYYRMANVTVLPSTTMGEAFGLVLLESLACGTPVIATNLPGVRTVVCDGIDGFLAQPGNVEDLEMNLLKMLELPEDIRNEMGVAGRRKVEEQYTWEKAARILEGIYNQVLIENRL